MEGNITFGIGQTFKLVSRQGKINKGMKVSGIKDSFPNLNNIWISVFQDISSYRVTFFISWKTLLVFYDIN